MKKKLVAVLAALLCCVVLFSACASHGKTLIKAGKEEISVNVFQLYLSRMKGSLAQSGANVTSESYWKGYISIDHTTVAEYYTAQVLEGLKHIAAAMILFEKKDLKLPQSTIDEIDAWIEEVIATDGEGSKTTLNSILAAYGANVTVLRDAAILEAKLALLKEHLYGVGGNLILDTSIEEYYKKTYYRGYQMQLANYYYDHEKDADGIAVRYTDDEFKKVAYVSAATLEKLSESERAKYVTVAREGEYATKYGAKYGDNIVLYRDGGDEVVAYDKDNGVINYRYDSKGELIIKNYTDEEMQARLQRAEQIATQCIGDEAKFLEYARELSDNSDFNNTYAPNGMYFGLGTYSADTAFGTFATELAKLEVGGTCVLESDSGYYVLMRAELDTGAWQNEENSRWFSTLRGLTLEYMLQEQTAMYLSQVSVDEALLAGVDITMVSSNVRY